MTAVWVVFSAFRPDAELAEAVLAAVREVGDRVIVVDDGSGDGWEQVWDRIQDTGARVVRSPQNEGIGAALNRGIRMALTEGADAVVTFDQDSTIQPGFIVALIDAHRSAVERRVDVAFVVPEFFAGVSQVHARANGVLYARHSIQSGMLMPRATLERVGLLREDLFIDLVDTEYELRCHAARLASIAAPALALGHSLGRQYVREMLGRPVRLPGIPPVVTLSSPFRYYYRVRNRRLINREYWRQAPAWIARDTILEVVHFANALLLARPRRDLWRLYRAGLRDARRRRTGRMPAELAAVAGSIEWNAPVQETRVDGI